MVIWLNGYEVFKELKRSLAIQLFSYAPFQMIIKLQTDISQVVKAIGFTTGNI